MNTRAVRAAVSSDTAERSSAMMGLLSWVSSHVPRNSRTMRSPTVSRSSESRVGSTSPGEKGSVTDAWKRARFVPKKWWTRAGSTPASPAIARMVARS